MRVFYSFLILFTFTVSLSKSKQKKEMRDNGSSEGDRLIDKILSSHRFNDLANKIVDKAIWKMNHINSSSVFTPKLAGRDGKPSLSTEERSEKRERKRHKSFIDVEAVLKTKVIPLSELSLRYNHFIKGSKPVVAKSANNKNILRQVSSEENTEKNPTKSKEVQKSKENSSQAQDENVKHKENRSEETSNVDEKTYTDKVSNLVNSTSEDEITTPKMQSAENQFGDEKVIVWGKKDESGETGNSDKSNEKKGKKRNEETSDESDETYRKRAEIENKTISGKDNDDENRINEDVLKGKELGIKQLQLEHDEIKKTSKHLIRREGDKTYTFEESPDYAEYQDKLTEVRQTRNKKVT